MRMSKVTVDAGACGFKIIIKAVERGSRMYSVELVSPCEMIRELNKELRARRFSRDVLSTIEGSEIYELCSRHVKHVSCPVAPAILKAIEVEAGLAVPRDVRMRVER